MAAFPGDLTVKHPQEDELLKLEDQLPYLYKDQSEGARKFTRNTFPIFSQPPMYLKFTSFKKTYSEPDCVSLLVGLFVVDTVYEKLKSRVVEPFPYLDADYEQMWIHDVINLLEEVRGILDDAKALGDLWYNERDEPSGSLFKHNVFYKSLEFIEYMAKETSFPIPSELDFYRTFDGSLKWVRKHAITSPGALEMGDLFCLDEDGILRKRDINGYELLFQFKQSSMTRSYPEELSLPAKQNLKDIEKQLDDELAKICPELEKFYTALVEEIDFGNYGVEDSINEIGASELRMVALDYYDRTQNEYKLINKTLVQKTSLYKYSEQRRRMFIRSFLQEYLKDHPAINNKKINTSKEALQTRYNKINRLT